MAKTTNLGGYTSPVGQKGYSAPTPTARPSNPPGVGGGRSTGQFMKTGSGKGSSRQLGGRR
jgi:hypothetical protein